MIKRSKDIYFNCAKQIFMPNLLLDIPENTEDEIKKYYFFNANFLLTFLFGILVI